MVFFTILWLYFVIILNFLRQNLLKFSQHIESCGIRILNTKKVGCVKAGFSIFANLCLLLLRKNWLIDFPEKRAPTKIEYILPVCQVSQKFRRRKRRKFTVSFAFCAHVDVINYRKTLMFSFDRRGLLELSSPARV